jgi:hypothetical protein
MNLGPDSDTSEDGHLEAVRDPCARHHTIGFSPNFRFPEPGACGDRRLMVILDASLLNYIASDASALVSCCWTPVSTFCRPKLVNRTHLTMTGSGGLHLDRKTHVLGVAGQGAVSRPNGQTFALGQTSPVDNDCTFSSTTMIPELCEAANRRSRMVCATYAYLRSPSIHFLT